MTSFRLVMATALAALVIAGALNTEAAFLVLALVAACILTLSFLPWRNWASASAKGSNAAVQPVARFMKEQLDADGAAIIGRDKFKHYSSADELLKWTELHEKGVVTDEEFDDARRKILKRDA